jgi:hypothetical protein
LVQGQEGWGIQYLMKLYIIQTVGCDEQGITSIVWHKHLFLFKDQAFKAAIEMPDACVLELTQTDSWNHEQIFTRN